MVLPNDPKPSPKPDDARPCGGVSELYVGADFGAMMYRMLQLVACGHDAPFHVSAPMRVTDEQVRERFLLRFYPAEAPAPEIKRCNTLDSPDYCALPDALESAIVKTGNTLLKVTVLGLSIAWLRARLAGIDLDAHERATRWPGPSSPAGERSSPSLN